MGDTTCELAYRLHFLRLNQGRLRQFPRIDLGAEPGVGGSQFPGTFLDQNLELLAAARQRISSLDDVLDVRARAEPSDRLSCRIPDRRAAGFEPSITAVHGADAMLQIIGGAP